MILHYMCVGKLAFFVYDGSYTPSIKLGGADFGNQQLHRKHRHKSTTIDRHMLHKQFGTKPVQLEALNQQRCTFSSDVSSSALDDVRSRWVDLQHSKQNKELICFGQARFIQLIESIILISVISLRQHTIHLYPDGNIMNTRSTSLHATGS